ncbi:MAG: hypothetical protein RML74_06960 [Acidobacteriota bacterium]|nr:hypothetical protein [Acidobacteriota bacterium]
MLRNVIANNDVGIWVNDAAAGQTAGTVVINDNNITSTVTNATGLRFDPDPTRGEFGCDEQLVGSGQWAEGR